MISNALVFTSVFLGIVSGPQTLEVSVSEGVAAVHFLVDGRRVAEISAPPWSVTHDFGPDLRVHRIGAIALDAAGREIGRAAQDLNLPRRSSEVEILLEDWTAGSPRTARVI